MIELLHQAPRQRGCGAARAGLTLAALLLLVLTTGCQPGINWRGYEFSSVHTEARRDDKLTLIYFRDWASPRCTQFEDTVLLDPAVLAAVRPLYAVPLQWNTLVDAQLAADLGVRDVPAIVILTPDQDVVARLQGTIEKSELINAITAARARFNSRNGARQPRAPAQ